MQITEVLVQRGLEAKQKLSKEEYQRIRDLVWQPKNRVIIDGTRDMVRAVEAIAILVFHDPVKEYLLFGRTAMYTQKTI